MNARKGGEAGNLRVVLADSRPWMRSALKLLVEQDGAMTVSAEAAKAEELARLLSISCPDAILLDCDLPGLRMSEFLQQLHSICPLVRVVAMCSRPEMQQAALSAGADAFVCKTESPEKLLEVLRECLAAVGTSKPVGWSDC